MWLVAAVLVLSGTLPSEVPNPKAWPVRPVEESVSEGVFRLANTTITFSLSVDPAAQGIYRISRYQTCDHDAKVCDPETLIWFRPTRNGRSTVAVIFYRLSRRKFVFFRKGYWYRVAPGSPEYQLELARAFRLYVLAIELRDGFSPGSLTF